jgi:hypothetical protein
VDNRAARRVAARVVRTLMRLGERLEREHYQTAITFIGVV